MRAGARRIDPTRIGALLSAAIALAACDGPPDDAVLDRWLEEARAAELEAQRGHEHEDESAGWTLTVLGRIRAEQPLLLRNPDLLAASTVEIGARPPLENAEHGEYRGVRISTLVERAGAPEPGVDEVTVVASDGFRATIAWDDLTRAPILLATHEGDERLRREEGGPLITVFPLDAFPDLLERYTESFWVYYVTHLVVGTPAPQVRVGEQVLDEAALLALPQHEVVASVGYRVGWPSEPVRVAGPALRDVLAAAGVTVPEGGRVRVQSLAPISRGDDRPTYVSSTEVASGDVLLGLRFGADDALITSRLGGPVVLAFTDEIAASHPEHDWLTFVTDLRSEPAPATGGAP